MQIGTEFFKSRIAHRFFRLFLGCTVLPLVILVVYSYMRVEDQLYEQSTLRMEKDCKLYGMALMDRLIQMEHLVRLYSAFLEVPTNPARLSPTLDDQVASTFQGLGLYRAGAGLSTLFGRLDLAADVDLSGQINPERGLSTLFTPTDDTSHRGVYLLVPCTSGGVDSLLVAQPVDTHLWAIGVDSMLPAMTELAVYDEGGRLLRATQLSAGTTLPPSSIGSLSGNYLHFDYEINGDTYLASGWSLFLKSHFEAGTWTIILSSTRSDVLNAMLEFKRTFPLVILLALWSILFLSLFFIRKTLTPLGVLKQGTERVGNRDFSTRVTIRSGDEFEQLADSFNTMTEHIDQQFNTLTLIGEIDRAILSSLDSSVIIPRSLRLISSFFSDQSITLAQRSIGDPTRLQLTSIKDGHQHDLEVDHVVLSDEEQAQLFDGASFRILTRKGDMPPFLLDRTSCESVLFLSLDSECHLIGALILDFPCPDGHRAEELIKQARQLANQLGIALANARLVSDLERLSIGTVEALARTVDAKSKWTAGHSERVAELAVKIGRAMNLNSAQLDLLFRAGLLHDIGKIGIPIAILDKPDSLSDEEYVQIKTHPAISGKILEPIEVYKDIIPLVVQHHERYDGTGYPAGLSGSEIDPGARILCVADVYDALISQRPYRQGWVKEHVLDYVRRNRGTMFDPEVVDVFLAVEV